MEDNNLNRLKVALVERQKSKHPKKYILTK